MSNLLAQAGNTKEQNDVVLQWVTFKLQEETYGINVMQVQEVLRYTDIAPVPGAPMSKTLCPPAAAMTIARRASDWPITSAKSGTCAHASAGSKGTTAAGASGEMPRRASTTSRAVWAG
jgi:hypothetical protein